MENLIDTNAFNHPYLYLFFISFCLSMFISYKLYTKSKLKTSYTKFFVICNISLGLWAFVVMFKLLLHPTIIHIYLQSITLILATINVWTLIMFIYYYTNMSISSKIAWYSLVPLLGVLFATLISFYMNFTSYDIYLTSKNISFYTIPYEQDIYFTILILLHLIYGIIAMVALSIFAREQIHENKKQAYLLILSVLVIFAGGLISSLRLHPYPDLHIYPAFVALFFIVIWKSIYSYNFFNILPIARTKILENLKQGVIVINEDKNIIDSNKSAKQICSMDKIYMKNIYDIYPKLKDNIDDLSTDYCVENFPIEKDGDIKYYNISIEPIQNNESKYVGSTLSFDDVTKLKENQLQLEKQKQDLQDKKKELKIQNEKLQNFASVLSHDLRNPLSVARGYSELIKEDTDNEEYFEQLDSSLIRIENIINDVLELTKKGKKIENKSEIDLESIVNESWGILKLSDSTIHVKDTIQFQADKSRLKNIFENIFRNSKDHTPKNKSTKIIVGSLRNKDGFYIEDNGPGIPEEKRDNIFEYGVTHSEDGTGLGLAIVKQIVTAHGWTISVTDAENLGGVRFEIKFKN